MQKYNIINCNMCKPIHPKSWEQELLEKGKHFAELIKTQYLYRMDVCGHGYEFSRGNNWELMEKFCQMIGADLWGM